MTAKDPFRLDGKVALVTGGTRGIGAAIAKEFALAGARIVLTGRDEAGAKAVAAEIAADAVGLGYQAGTLAAVDALAASVREQAGRLDILVNNAAILKPHRIERLTEAEFDDLFQVNVKSALFLSRALLPLLADSKGTVVNVTALGGHAPMAGIGAYCASKAALLNLTRTLAKEWAPKGVRVNALTPGSTATDMIMPKDPDRRAAFVDDMAKQILLGRIGEPVEIARAVRFLASDAASYITGQALVCDGGMLA
jgi:NAD(P)-dependent dehydrogenase (short-subunit alcohol dehydrogenase family)